jgi:hypothetical protein
MFFQEGKQIAALAAMALLPTIYGFRDHVDAGGLISYGMRVARTPEAIRRHPVRGPVVGC